MIRKSTTVLTLCLVGIASGAIHLHFNPEILSAQSNQLIESRMEIESAKIKKEAEERLKDFVELGRPNIPELIRSSARRPSQWQQRDKDRAIAALSKNQYDVLVVPFQAQGNALDPVARSLMTMSLAHRIDTGTDLSVADPVLVSKAFGTSVRSIPEDEIKKISDIVGATKVIIGHASHDLKGSYTVVASLSDTNNFPSNEISQQERYESDDIRFDHNELPYLSFLRYRDTIINTLFPNTELSDKTLNPSIPLPAIAGDIATNNPDQRFAAAHLLQFMGVLHPERNIDRARDQLIERSLILSEYMDSNDSEVKLLKARALLMLHRRAAAMEFLDEDSSIHHQMLKNYALGNYAENIEESENQNPFLSFLILQVLNNRLRLDYQGTPNEDRLATLGSKFEVWGPLVQKALVDKYVWQSRSNSLLKLAVDKSNPKSALSLNSFAVRQTISPSDSSEYEITKLVMEHLDIVQQESPSEMGLGPKNQDYVELLRSMAINNVIGRIRHSHHALGKPEHAFKLVNRFETLFKDQPEFTVASAQAKLALVRKSKGQEIAILENEVKELAKNGHNWIGRQSDDTWWITGDISRYFAEFTTIRGPLLDQLLYLSDRPTNSYSLSIAGDRDKSNKSLTTCMENTISKFICFAEYYKFVSQSEKSEPQIQLLTKELQNRYQGHPERLEFIANAYADLGDQHKADDVYRKAISLGTDVWSAYANLGGSLIQQSRYSDARDVVLKYPPIRGEKKTNRVRLSNRIFDFGSDLYWAGAYEEAMDLYEVSANLNTGSGAEMTSAARLAMIKGDYKTAAAAFLRTARRYNSEYSIRDLLGLATVTGNLDWATTLLEGMQGEFDKPELWNGAFFVQRSSNTKIASILQWSLSNVQSQEDYRSQDLAMRQVFMAGTIDRDIQQSFPKLLQEIDPRPPITVNKYGRNRDRDRWIGPDRNFGEPVIQAEAGAELKRRLIYAAEALEALSVKDYSLAFNLLEEASQYYTLDEFLPYYAFAAAKSDKTKRIKLYLANFEEGTLNNDPMNIGEDGTEFDSNLSHAFLYSVNGQHEESLASLTKTRNNMLYRPSRNLFARYQLLEAAYLIYEDTGLEAYRNFALDLARRYTVIEPFQAYTHSFVAILSDNREERINALARVQILDPNSRSIRRAERSELERARELSKNGFPRNHPGLTAGI